MRAITPRRVKFTQIGNQQIAGEAAVSVDAAAAAAAAAAGVSLVGHTHGVVKGIGPDWHTRDHLMNRITDGGNARARVEARRRLKSATVGCEIRYKPRISSRYMTSETKKAASWAALFLPEIPNLLPKTLPNGRSLRKTCYKSGTYMVRTKRLELLQLAPLEPKS